MCECQICIKVNKLEVLLLILRIFSLKFSTSWKEIFRGIAERRILRNENI